MKPYRSTSTRGLTLIEALVTVAIISLATIAVAGAVVFFYRTNAYTMEQSVAINEARRGIDEAVRNVREATYAETGSYPVESAATDSFTFYSDIDKDMDVERVRLFLDGTTFKRGVTKPAGTPVTYSGQPENVDLLAQDVRNGAENVDVFSYVNATGTPVTDLSSITDISYVNITLVVNVNPSKLPRSFTLTSSATMRNLR